MFMFTFFFFTFFSATFFATNDSVNKIVKTISVVSSIKVDYVDELIKQYQEIENNSKILEELAQESEHIGHTLEYYTKQVVIIMNSEKNEPEKTSKLQSLFHDGKFILDQLNDYLN